MSTNTVLIDGERGLGLRIIVDQTADDYVRRERRVRCEIIELSLRPGQPIRELASVDLLPAAIENLDSLFGVTIKEPDPFPPDPESIAALRAVISRLCHLQSDVCEHLIGYDGPNDCLCGEGGFWLADEWPNARAGWRNEERALEWIEAVVRAELAVSKTRFTRLERLAQGVRALGGRLTVAARAARLDPPDYL